MPGCATRCSQPRQRRSAINGAVPFCTLAASPAPSDTSKRSLSDQVVVTAIPGLRADIHVHGS
jgi:hypothetical protein